MDHYINAKNRNIFTIWEKGESEGDSTTPSVASSRYRQEMTSLISILANRDAPQPIVSIGCGNAFVEANLVRDGFSVVGLDFHEEAIALAKKKGVNASLQDLTKWSPQIASYQFAYCDGIVGHLYSEKSELQPILLNIYRSLIPGSSIVISNDASRNGNAVQSHPDVPGFHWFSDEYLEGQLSKAGFRNTLCHNFHYQRPISGERIRAVISAVKPV